MVPDVNRTSGTADGPAPAPSVTSAAPQPRHICRRTRASADSVAVIRGALAKDRYRPPVINHMLKARAQGTVAMTRSRWRAWYGWCRHHHMDPIRCTTPKLCEYLESFFDSGKAVTTIRRYLSAVATTICLSTKHDIVAGNVRLTVLLQGFNKQRPHCPVIIPKGDLTLVLMALRRIPYEPIHKASRKSLTL